MTDKEAADIAARLAAATPGPWWNHGYYIYYGSRDDTASDRVSNPNKLAHTRRYGNESADAAFIAHAPADIKALLAERAALLDAIQRRDKAVQLMSELMKESTQ